MEQNNIPPFLNGNRDENPTKINVSSSRTIDVVGTADVRYEDHGQLKSQYTTYAEAWAGALETRKELLQNFLLQKKSKQISMNDFTKDGHLMSSLSILSFSSFLVFDRVDELS